MTACQFCTYPRDGLKEDAPCPECGRVPIDALPPLAEESLKHRASLALGARLAQMACAMRGTHLVCLAMLAFTTNHAFWLALWLGLAAIAAVNAIAAFKLTAKGFAPFRTWARPTLRTLASFDLALAAAVSLAHLTTRNTPDADLAAAITALVILVATWAARSLAWVAVIRSLAPRLDSDRLTRRINAWFTYAGVAAMTSAVGVIGVVLTALIPILAPFTVIAAIPFSLLMAVLGSIALIGAINLHVHLARELRSAAN